ncbi:diguanylate cyclase [Permianibacter sp. IMCC34836]|uniref:diguanylate cyclase domain-containing protein n=1 Tax=Permianibacter fluminis TaxID=2738515 RepID=UPI001553F483|nr:diguanylate cyclase [Permianibacter fluminis]NQD35529.1 diguanylate cyclase [Permianibacter fluminis]
MEQMELLTEQLALLRRGAQEFEILQGRVAELDSLTRTFGAFNRHMAEQLAEAQALVQQWRNFFSLSLDMLCVADTDGRFHDINPAFVRALGYDRADLLQQPFLDLVHPEDLAATLAEIDKLKTGVDTISFDNRYRCKDGHWLWLNWTTPAPAPGSKLLYAIARDITERKRSEADILHRAQHDALTGLYNRAALMHELAAAGERHRRNRSHRVALLFLDLDGFKPINDCHGHQAGDCLLAELGRRLRARGRSTDMIARIGGDEFVVLFQGNEAATAELLSQRYRDCFTEPFLLATQPVQLSASIGYAALDAGMLDAEQLLELADRRMYEHKREHQHARHA